MRAHKRSLAVVAVGGVLCALAALGIEVGKSGPAVSAQQDNWTTPAAQKQGFRLLETREASGPPAYPVKPGDLLFFTNSGTSFGATNKIDSVVVVDAKARKPIAVSELEPAWAEGFQSHGIAVSPDARYVYLPAIAPANSKNPSRYLVLDARTLKIHQIIVNGARRGPHHMKVFEDWMGRSRILAEDFNWTDPYPKDPGKGFFIFDHTDHNKVVAGMTTGDLRGNPYAGFVAPDGRYVYYAMNAPSRPIRHELEGWVAKIDMQTWEIAQQIPIGRDPIWVAFTQDNRFAFVSLAEPSMVVKIERSNDPKVGDKVVGESRTGPGVYGLTLNINDTELWTADKGEGIPAAQQRRTVTVLDPRSMHIKLTIDTGCRTNDHLILSPDGSEMWAMCNGSQEIVVIDTKTYTLKGRIPMPNQGAVHGGVFVSYTQGSGGSVVGEVVSDQNGLHGSARAARQKGVPWTVAAVR